MPSLISIRLSAALLAIFAGGAGSCLGAPWLLNAQQASYATRPAYIRDHFAHIDTLPFDGMVISSETGRALMAGPEWSEVRMAEEFAPLNGLHFTRMKHLFALVIVDRPADFFDDWAGTIANFRVLARVLRAQGFSGLFLDNEEYLRPLFNYPDDCAYPERSLQSYQDQARRRGREIMEAMAAEAPELVVLVAHGPYSSFEGTPAAVRAGQTAWEKEELRGPFTVGLIEGMDSRGRMVDGGELYPYRSAEDFERSFTFRKSEIAAAETGCDFIPGYLRPVWGRKVDIGFGLYQLSYLGVPMDPPTLRSTLAHALRQADGVVWLYFEGENWNAPGEFALDWLEAVVGARADVAGATAGNAAPWVEFTQPGDGTVWQQPAVLTLQARAAGGESGVAKVEFWDGGQRLGERTSGPFVFPLAEPGVGVHRFSARVTDTLGREAVSAVVVLTITDRFHAAINFQPEAVTPPPGYWSDTGETFGPRPGGLAYGWNESHSGSMRLRSTDEELRLATLGQMREGGTWEIAVPPGAYRVTVAIGDPAFASVHTVNVEGVSYWQARPLAAGETLEQAATVVVTDGRLSLDQGGGGFEATRLASVLVTKPDAPPMPPSGLTVWLAGAGEVALKWTDRSASVGGFVVERSTEGGFSAPIARIALPAGTRTCRDSGLPGGVRYFYRIRAVGADGESAPSNVPAIFVPPEDADGDGIADASEVPPCVPGVNDRVADSDGDGFSNAEEVSAQTLPWSGESFPAIALQIAPEGNGALRVSYGFLAVAGLGYGVEFTDFLAAGVWTLCEGWPQLGEAGWTAGEEVTTSLSRIYRLRIYP